MVKFMVFFIIMYNLFNFNIEYFYEIFFPHEFLIKINLAHSLLLLDRNILIVLSFQPYFSWCFLCLHNHRVDPYPLVRFLKLSFDWYIVLSLLVCLLCMLVPMIDVSRISVFEKS
jgi:hypothetical protein